ncbi:hypothetical protein [Mucilaginibacter sp.]|uniref:hypothetical protein n=1 Tax=Mucilaginibacter sp. TaxID=1882438 RepID=UPI003B00CEAB
MDIELKNRIAAKIIQSEDDVLLNEVKALVGLSETDFWYDLPSELKYNIDQAKLQLDRGEGIAHKEVMQDMKNRFLKQ